MIEEFIQRLQQTEVEADGILASAKEKVQTINRDLESSLAEVRSSVSQELQHRLDVIDKQFNEQVDSEQRQLRQEMKQQLADLEHGALECRQAALERFISHLT
jgi:vacuolar-type H+-ATPase subunit E/Vma4